MASAADIINRAANDLGILRLGQALQAQDKTRITQAYAEIYADLKSEGIATWASDGDVPAECVRWVAALVADGCLNNYGVSNDRFQRIKADFANARPEIRRLTATDYVSTEDAKDF